MPAYNYVGARALIRASTVVTDKSELDVSNVDYYSILRYMMEILPEEEFDLIYEDAYNAVRLERSMNMNDIVKVDPVVVDEWDAFDAMLDQQDLGDIDPSTYQEQEDNGCAGGGCII